jgi:hypothetical protein
MFEGSFHNIPFMIILFFDPKIKNLEMFWK